MLSLDQKTKAEFCVGDLFDHYRGDRLRQSDRLPGDLRFITAGAEDRGLGGYVGNDVFIYKDPITLDMFGNCFYQGVDCGGDDNIIFLENDSISKRTKLFVASVIGRALEGRYSYAKQFRLGSFQKLSVSLPVTDDGSPDWDWMEQYIRQIEQRHLDVIAQHNAREQQLLAAIYGDDPVSEPVAHGYAEFRIGDVFEAVRSTAKVQSFTKSEVPTSVCSLPAVSGSTVNNSIGVYVNPLEHEVLQGMFAMAPHSGFVTYHSENFGIAHNAYAFDFKAKDISKRSYIYCLSALNKGNDVKFGYSNLASWGRFKDDEIMLPVTLSGDIDFEFMEQYIAYIETRERETVARYVRHKSSVC